MAVRRGDLSVLDLPELGPVTGECELVCNGEHLDRVVRDGMLSARVSLEIATADFKAMLVPPDPRKGLTGGGRRGTRGRSDAPSIVKHLAELAERGVEVRVLHAGVPSSAALRELKNLPGNLTIRRCPRLHSKAIVVDAGWAYLGSANLTGAGLGAKGETRRNFEMGVITRSAAMVEAISARFNTLWEGDHCKSCGRRDVCPVPLEEPDLR
jgi:phosphatidylserine/phosphatidylglycerophosphate/cardiolipin synthase-like enzyme